MTLSDGASEDVNAYQYVKQHTLPQESKTPNSNRLLVCPQNSSPDAWSRKDDPSRLGVNLKTNLNCSQDDTECIPPTKRTSVDCK